VILTHPPFDGGVVGAGAGIVVVAFAVVAFDGGASGFSVRGVGADGASGAKTVGPDAGTGSVLSPLE